MTLCIAAHCHEAGQRRIILCADALIGDESGVVESEFKFELQLAPGLSAMFAGPVNDARDALRIFQERLCEKIPTNASIKGQLWDAMKEVKLSLADHGVRRTTLQLIVAGFLGGHPKLFYVDQKVVFEFPDFLAIGTGASAAAAMLQWRKFTRNVWLHDAMYFIYEAKRIGETSPFVGQKTRMFVIEDNRPDWVRVHTVVALGIAFLECQFERYGPQPFIKGKFPLEGLVG